MNKENEWRFPKDLEEIQLPAFPIHCLPEALREYVEAGSEELQIPIAMAASGVLGVISVSNQGKYLVEGKEGWKEPVNLYILIIARPSERKSPTMVKITKPLVEYEKEENERRKFDIRNSKDRMELYENKLKKLKNKCGKKGDNEQDTINQIEQLNQEMDKLEIVNALRLFVDDITPEALVSVMKENNEKIGMFSDEGGIFSTLAGRYSNNIPNIEIVLKAFNGTSVSVDRKGRDTEKLDNPYLTILLFVQPIVLENMLQNSEFRGKGLCARFLYCYPQSKVGTRNVNSLPMKSETEEKYSNIIKNLLKKDIKEPRILKLSPKVYELSQNFAEDIEIKLGKELKPIEEWVGKLHGVILRIAGNLHIVENIDNDNLIISEQTMQDAIEIGLYYLENAKKVYKIAGVNGVAAKAKDIVKKLKEKHISGIQKKYDIFKATRKTAYDKIEDSEEAFEYLFKEGYMKIKETEINIEQKKEGGRPPDILIELNPLVFDGS